tara:strand:- start:26063 stop:26509 length:447 start_codon:yes stop_codon:yes gene_type:complete
MAFTYTSALTSTRDQVRFLLQDTTNTSTRPALMQDGEIDWALTVEANIYMAGALCAEALATRFRGLSSKKVGDLQLAYSPTMWEGIAKRLRARGSLHAVPTAGGITITDRDAIWADTDLLRPTFFDRVLGDRTSLPASRGDWEEEELP